MIRLIVDRNTARLLAFGDQQKIGMKLLITGRKSCPHQN